MRQSEGYRPEKNLLFKQESHRTSLSGNPRAMALNETCSLRVTYLTFLVVGPKAITLNKMCCSRVT